MRGPDSLRSSSTFQLADRHGSLVCKCEVADTPWRRLRGLLGRPGLEPGHGLLIRPGWSVHTAFMRFPIDVVFLDRQLVVLRIVPGLEPWRSASRWGAKSVLELPAGTCATVGVAAGDRLEHRSQPVR
jgi:uncharacterized protein